MQPKKSLGQNFLMHAQTAERIADAAGLSTDSVALEIGPGTGMLTRTLLKRARKVVAVEADAELIPMLEATFKEEITSGKLQLLHADIRAFDPKVIGESYALVANIPYYITGEIIRQFLTTEHKPTSMTLLVQKEVVVRIAREKKESLLSLSVKTFGVPSYCFTVPRGAFKPAPKVDSAVLHISGIRSPFGDSEEETAFFEMLHAGFAHKRKFLARNLEEIALPAAIQAAFAATGISERVRSEDLSLTAWQHLHQALQRTHG